MVTMVEAGIQDPGTRPRRAGGDPSDPALLAAALVAAQEGALLAARRLLAMAEAADRHTPTAPFGPPIGGSEPARPRGLSSREREVLWLLAAGHSNRRIAQALFLSPRAVQHHVANVYRKIGAHCRAEATAHALHHGLA